MNVVVIPCFNRPEFLYWTLERIKLAEGAEENFYLFCFDYGFDRLNYDVIREFPFDHKIIVRDRWHNSMTKQSRNVLEGLKHAAELSGNDSSLIYLIEDDVMIATDFFYWHKAIHEKETLFCAIASKNVNRTIDYKNAKPHQYYLSTRDYCGIGTSFRSYVIKEFISPHINSYYYSDCIGYIKAAFPDNFLSTEFSEQDGLIRRIQSVSGLPTAYPFIPKSYHAGFYGKGRKQRTYVSDFKKRIEFIGSIIFSRAEMRKFALNEYFYIDSEPQELNNKTGYNLRRIKI
jgi:hypothetical protein